jgi:hypothetical protein
VRGGRLMATLLLGLLIITTGGVFAWYRIRTRGLEAFIEETRRFIALQKRKDMMTFMAAKRFFIILGRRGNEQGRRLYVQHQEREKERIARYQQEEKERAARLAYAKELFGEPKAGSVSRQYLIEIGSEVERLVSGFTPEQRRLLGELSPEDKKEFQRACRLHGYPDGDLEYAFVKALEEVDYRRKSRNGYELSEAFDTIGWKSRLEVSGRARSALVNSLRRSEQIQAEAQARQTQRGSARSTAGSSSSSWLSSPWVWLLGAYWIGQHNQKMQQQQRMNEPDFSKYPYTMDGRHWNPYKRYERR